MGPLSDAEVRHFLDKGYVHIRGAFPRIVADQWASECFARLGYDEQDPATWVQDRIHMPATRHVEVAEFAPVAYQAMVQLAGGEARIKQPARWGNAFIANFGERAGDAWQPAGPDTPGWHCDGDFFLHFLDSPEQAMLVFVNWTDVVHQGGPTYIATDSVPVVAKFLADHPEGVQPHGFGFKDLIRECHHFEEAVGEAGDVFLLHPLMLHAGSQNKLRVKRIITNPPLALENPFEFDRPDGNYSVVERATLQALGVDRLPFRANSPRERLDPKRVHEEAKILADERARAAAVA